jgi:hypothetical protein
VKRVAHRLIVLAALLALAAPAVAHASPQAVIRDCAEDGHLDGKYSNDDLRQAADTLPSDLDEYSDCREVINGAITGGSDKGGGRDSGGSPKGSASAAKAERSARAHDASALKDATSRGSKPKLHVDGRTVEPGANGLFDTASSSNGLPLPLLLALIAVGLLAMVGALYALRRRVPALAKIPLPSLSSLPRVPFPRLRR